MINKFPPVKVSVIMPVYNTEQYVERAIVSLMEQTLNDVQFIIIDDGSKDNSLSIIKKTIERYPLRKGQVTLISRENQGVSITRSQGVDLARGEYVIHLDSDDWAEKNWLELLYNSAINSNSDIIICNFNIFIGKAKKLSIQNSMTNGLDCIKLLLDGELHGALWNKLIRRSLLINNNVRFKNCINYLEDLTYIIQAFYFTNNVTHISEPLVNYNCSNELSITSSMSREKFNEIFEAISFIEDFLSEKEIIDRYVDYISRMKMFFVASLLLACDGVVCDETIWKNKLNYKDIIFSSLPLHHKVILFVFKMDVKLIFRFVFRLISFLKHLKIYYKRR